MQDPDKPADHEDNHEDDHDDGDGDYEDLAVPGPSGQTSQHKENDVDQ